MEKINVTGKQALILAECCKYSKEKKEAEKKLKASRAKLTLSKKGTYVNTIGDSVTITESKNKSAIDPKELFFKLKKKGIVKKFFTCIKVNVTDLKKFLAISEIEKMQEELEPTKKFSFK